MVTRVPSPGAVSISNSLTRRLLPGQAQAHALAGGPAVGQRQLDVGDAGARSSKCRRRPRRTPSSSDLPAHLAAAAVDQRVARQLAGRGDHLGLVDQREARAPASACAPSGGERRCPARSRSGRIVSLRRSAHRTPPRVADAQQRPCRARRSSAVRTPSSDRPSSTSVMATAGCMPTTTVVASRMRDMRGDVGEHAADERVDHLERGDVDQHALGAGARDLVGQVVLQRQRQSGPACRPGW